VECIVFSILVLAEGGECSLQVKHYSAIEVDTPVFIAFLNRSCWAEKECHLSLLNQAKIERAKNQRSFTASTTKTLTKFLEAPSHFFHVGNSFRSLLPAAKTARQAVLSRGT
jgi:hypothetical protein